MCYLLFLTETGRNKSWKIAPKGAGFSLNADWEFADWELLHMFFIDILKEGSVFLPRNTWALRVLENYTKVGECRLGFWLLVCDKEILHVFPIDILKYGKCP